MNGFKFVLFLIIITLSFHSSSKTKKKKKLRSKVKKSTTKVQLRKKTSSSKKHSFLKNNFKGKNIFFEYQSKVLSNNNPYPESSSENWTTLPAEQFNANIGFDLKLFSGKFKFNSFLRHSSSPLYKQGPSTLPYVFSPQKLITRELFKLEYGEKEGNPRQRLIFTQLAFEKRFKKLKLSVGRIFIRFGEGHTINPINPFSHTLALSDTYGVYQGNDGVKILFNRDPKLKLHLYILADKTFTEDDGKITKTILLRGDWRKSNSLHMNYIVGEDQKRHKYGLEVKKSFAKSFGFIQFVKFSKRLDGELATSKGLTHYLLGYEFDINKVWTTRVEFGNISNDPSLVENNTTSYLPYSSINSLYNLFRINDRWSSEFSFTQDNNSSAAFYKFSATYHYNKNYTVRLYSSEQFSSPAASNRYTEQQFIPSQTGIALRSDF